MDFISKRLIHTFLFISLFYQSVLPQHVMPIGDLIKPLETTRSQVESLLIPEKIWAGSTRYKTASGQLEIFYATSRCDHSGWNVPKDTVISYRFESSNPLSTKDADIDSASILKIVDDSSTTHFVDAGKGVV